MSLSILPKDVIVFMIYKVKYPSDVLNLLQTCKLMKFIADNKINWQILLNNHFDIITEQFADFLDTPREKYLYLSNTISSRYEEPKKCFVTIGCFKFNHEFPYYEKFKEYLENILEPLFKKDKHNVWLESANIFAGRDIGFGNFELDQWVFSYTYSDIIVLYCIDDNIQYVNEKSINLVPTYNYIEKLFKSIVYKLYGKQYANDGKWETYICECITQTRIYHLDKLQNTNDLLYSFLIYQDSGNNYYKLSREECELIYIFDSLQCMGYIGPYGYDHSSNNIKFKVQDFMDNLHEFYN